MEFTISGLNPSEEVTISFVVFPNGTTPPVSPAENILVGMTEAKIVDTTTASGTYTVSGEVAAGLTHGELRITLSDYGYTIDNAIILRSGGVHVTVGVDV